MDIAVNENRRREHTPQILSDTDPPDLNETPEQPPAAVGMPHRRKFLYMLNDQLDKLSLPFDLNEELIFGKLTALDQLRKADCALHCLTLARIAELALINAGACADGCEFRAAGDMLVNPSKLLIHIKGRRRPVLKRRHGKLSEQLSREAEPQVSFMNWFKKNATIEISREALLPELYDRLEKSGRIAPWYLTHFKSRMEKIAEAIGFLSAWNVSGAEELFAKMQAASPETRKFITTHLCNFKDNLFNTIGRDIRRIEKGLDLKGDLLTSAAAVDIGRYAEVRLP